MYNFDTHYILSIFYHTHTHDNRMIFVVSLLLFLASTRVRAALPSNHEFANRLDRMEAHMEALNQQMNNVYEAHIYNPETKKRYAMSEFSAKLFRPTVTMKQQRHAVSKFSTYPNAVPIPS